MVKGAKMKSVQKIIFIVLGVMAVNATYGSVQMCMSNDVAVSVVLDPSISISSYQPTSSGTSNQWGATGTWKVTTSSTSYGTIRGRSACLSQNYGLTSVYNGGCGTNSTNCLYKGNNGVLIDNNKVVTGGEQNAVNGTGTSYCFCKITHPVASLWGFYNSHGSLSACLSRCAYNCGYYVQNDDTFRSALFGSVAN